MNHDKTKFPHNLHIRVDDWLNGHLNREVEETGESRSTVARLALVAHYSLKDDRAAAAKKNKRAEDKARKVAAKRASKRER